VVPTGGNRDRMQEVRGVDGRAMSRSGRPGKVRVAVVGAGLMGRWHAYFARRAGAEVSAIVDCRNAAAASLASKLRAQPAAKLSEVFRRSPPDVVHICTPAETHEELAAEALDQGAHIIVEKPVAPTLAATQRLLSRAALSGRLLVPVHQFPFQCGFGRLLTEQAQIGALRSVEWVAFSNAADGRPGPARKAALLDILAHAPSLLLPFGLLDSLETLALRRFTNDAVELCGTNGPTQVTLQIDLCCRPVQNELHVFGDRGVAVADLFHGYSFIDCAPTTRGAKLCRPFRLAGRRLWSASANLVERAVRRELAYPGLGALLGTVYEAIHTGAPTPVSPSEALASAALCQRVWEVAHRS
jgi:predicted dehydrogenase